MSSLEQVSFTSGEISPSLYARTDLAKYQSAAQTMTNFSPLQYGGVANRSGFKLLAGSAYASSRFIPFSRSSSENFLIVLMGGSGNFRFIKNGSLITYAGKSISNVTQAGTGVVTANAHGYSNGDRILIGGIKGMHQLNNMEFIVGGVTANTFTLASAEAPYGGIGTTGYDAYVAGGTAYKIYELASGYSADEQAVLDYAQSVDLMILTVASKPVKALRYLGDTSWTISNYDLSGGPFLTMNSGSTTMTADAAGMLTTTLTASAATFSASNVGQLVYLETKDFGKPWEFNVAVAVGDIRRAGSNFYKSQTAANTGTLRPAHSYGDYSDGNVVWRYLHSGSGIVRITGYTSSTQVSVTPITYVPEGLLSLASERWAFGAFAGTQGYPSKCTFYQQRLILAATTAQPETVWTSKTGDYSNFGKSNPLADDDALTFTLAGKQLNHIRFMDGIQDLMCFSSSAEYQIAGGQNQILTPVTLAVRPQSYIGCNTVKPVTVNNRLIYVQDQCGVIRDFGYQADAQSASGYVGEDLTIFANHLFEGYTIIRLAASKYPEQIIWALRSDGVLLRCVYSREQQVLGWSVIETNGTINDIGVIPEGGEDVLYIAVTRGELNTLERLQTRRLLDVADSFFVDKGFVFDGRNTGSTTMTLSGGTAWDETETLTLTSSAATFTSDDVGQYIFLTGGTVSKLQITAYSSSTSVDVVPVNTIPEDKRNTATTDWAYALVIVGSLSPLEGRTVSILADGNVHPQETVANGAVTLQYAASRLSIGLAYQSYLRTLRINVIGGETTQNKKKLVNSVSLVCQNTRGLFAGARESELREFRPEKRTDYTSPLGTTTGLLEQAITCSWETGGSILIRQSDPLPATILSVIPNITVGGV